MELIVAIVVMVIILAVVFRKAIRVIAEVSENIMRVWALDSKKDINKRAEKLATYARDNDLVNIDDLESVFSKGTVKVSDDIKNARETRANSTTSTSELGDSNE